MIVFLVLLLAAIGGWWLWRNVSASKPIPLSDQSAKATARTVPNTANTPLSSVVVQPVNKAEFISSMLTAASKAPIEFYGKVIDQDGNPITGAKVSGEAMHFLGRR